LFDFVKAVDELNLLLEKMDIKIIVKGILTCTEDKELFSKNIEFHENLTDECLTHYYKKSVALLFTSEIEGNFPTQVNEALQLGTLIVATDIALITDELGELQNKLPLYSIGDWKGMANGLFNIITENQVAKKNQLIVQEFARTHFTYANFEYNFKKIIN
jgi:glycosyltransferase involved in cell wall biosynthesis